MERRHIKWVPLVLAALFFGYQYFSSEKFTNPETGRKSHVGLSTRQEATLGLQSYEQILSQAPTITSGPELDMVQRVVQRLVGATDAAGKDFDWRVSLVRSSQVNAFCLPGGKIVVYTGILPVANNEAALATVLGHEMAHATSRHGAQRVFEQNLTQTAMAGVAGSLSDMDYEKQRAVMGAIGAGSAERGHGRCPIMPRLLQVYSSREHGVIRRSALDVELTGEVAVTAVTGEAGRADQPGHHCRRL